MQPFLFRFRPVPSELFIHLFTKKVYPRTVCLLSYLGFTFDGSYVVGGSDEGKLNSALPLLPR